MNRIVLLSSQHKFIIQKLNVISEAPASGLAQQNIYVSPLITAILLFLS